MALIRCGNAGALRGLFAGRKGTGTGQTGANFSEFNTLTISSGSLGMSGTLLCDHAGTLTGTAQYSYTKVFNDGTHGAQTSATTTPVDCSDCYMVILTTGEAITFTYTE